MAYAFDLIAADGSIDQLMVGEFPSDCDAVREARKALAGNGRAVLVDVWLQDRRIGRVEG